MPQVAVISGGSSGIGLAIARQLAQAGWSLVLMARDEQRLADARREVEALFTQPQQRCLVCPADVCDREVVHAAAHSSVSALGPPDWLVASAGVARPGYFAELDDEIFDRTMQVNYTGTLNLVRAYMPSMLERAHGHITLVSSAAGLVGVFGYSAYSPSKFAVRGLGEVLRAELKPHGIGVSVLYPPDTDTPQLAEENRTKPPETRAIAGSAGVWSADDVARITIDGMRRRRFSITPGLETTLLAWLHAPLAPFLRWMFDRQARIARGG